MVSITMLDGGSPPHLSRDLELLEFDAIYVCTGYLHTKKNALESAFIVFILE